MIETQRTEFVLICTI